MLLSREYLTSKMSEVTAQYRVRVWSFASYAHNMLSANPGYYKRLLEAPIYPNPSFYQIQLDIPRYQFPQNTKAEQLNLDSYQQMAGRLFMTYAKRNTINQYI